VGGGGGENPHTFSEKLWNPKKKKKKKNNCFVFLFVLGGGGGGVKAPSLLQKIHELI